MCVTELGMLAEKALLSAGNLDYLLQVAIHAYRVKLPFVC